MLSLIQLDPAHPMHPVEAGNSLLHSTGVLAGRLEAMLRPAAMCGIILLLCMHLSASQAAVQNESAVSQTYESVHLTEAARKAKGDEGSLEDLLHWAIENSDPEQLKQQAEIVGRENMDLSDRQKEVQQMIRDMKAAPTEIDLIKDTIGVLTNGSAPSEEILIALEALQSLVEPIDNANDLHTLHGLHPVVRLLAHESPSLQAAAAFVLGTAASNNNKFQEQLMHLHPDSITLLLQVTVSSSKETSKKGLYAIAALLRNNADARALFYGNQGVQHLIHLLKAPNQTGQVRLKVLNLVTDLSQLDLSEKVVAADRQQLLAAVHPLACDTSESNVEEALMAVKGILECSDAEAPQIAQDSGASAALQNLKQSLKSHLNSICHVESYHVEDVQCKRDLLHLCNDIDSMPCLSSKAAKSEKQKDSQHEDL